MRIDQSGFKASTQLQNQSAKKLSSGDAIGGSTDAIKAQAELEANKKVVQAKDESLGQLIDLKA